MAAPAIDLSRVDVGPNEAAAAYAAAAENLAVYIRLQWPNWIRGRHIEELIKALHRIERGEIDRLLVLMPPRHSKSVTVSQFFPAWYLGRHPDRDIICASYGQDLANDFGLKVRNLIADPMHRTIFPKSVLSSDSAAKDQFGLTGGGRYWAVGRGSATTGRGAHCFIIDDPIKDQVEAQSETLRRQLHEWFSSVVYTRLQDPGGAVIITETLWHEDDLAGRQMRDHMDDGWVVVRMPAIAQQDEGWRKEGEALWPEKFPLERLRRIQRQLTTEQWMSLYQQQSVADEGTIFKLQWLEDCYLDPGRELTPTKAAGLTKYITVDPATSKRRGSDYTTMWVLGLGADRCVYVLDALRDKLTTPAERADALFRLHRKWRPVNRVLYEEYGLMGDVAYIRERQSGTDGRAPYSFRITPVGGKLQKNERIKQLEPFFREGRIKMPRRLDGMSEGKRVDLIQDAFVPEYKAFPAAAHDDMLDAFARIVNDHVTLDWPLTSEEIEEYQAEVEADAERGSWMSQ